MKLELKHLAGYLPYGLRVRSYTIETLIGLKDNYVITKEFNLPYPIINCRPILRPLSDLTKNIEINGKKFIPINKLQLDYDWSDKISIYDFSTQSLLGMEDVYFVVDTLLEWHFDIYGLIENGLAVDINTI